METPDEGSVVLESCIAKAASLEPKALQQFLSVLALELTICARGAYVAGSCESAAPAMARAGNEALHLVAGILCRLAFAQSIDHDALADGFRELSANADIGPCVRQSLQRAMRQVERAAD